MKSPFSEGRFEYDAKHCFYLPQTCVAGIEQHKPIYLIGSRGSGKTTLLMSMNWHERTTNPTLKRQLDGNPFRGLYIGTYIKLPKIQLRTFDKWLRDEDEDIHGLLVGRYFDLVFIETLSLAISELLAEQHLGVPPAVERDAVCEWASDYSAELADVETTSLNSVAAFHGAVRSVRRSLELSARLRQPVADCLERFAVDQIGSWSSAMSHRLAHLCNHDTRNQDGTWHFKVCMDEGECLSAFQQLVVNTIVRLAEWPLFPVVSYVSRPHDITTTLVPHLTHQKADRELIVLDSMEHAEFVDFAQGVATVRCQEALQQPNAEFNARVVLGELDINGLLIHILERSESPKAKKLLADAKNFSVNTEYTGDGLPIYQAYLASQLKISAPPVSDKKAERHISSQQYRKKMVAAFLAICNELRLRSIPYASADMVLMISDSCVRVFCHRLIISFAVLEAL